MSGHGQVCFRGKSGHSIGLQCLVVTLPRRKLYRWDDPKLST